MSQELVSLNRFVNPLWSLPGVNITPHVSGVSPSKQVSGDGQDKTMCFRPNPVHRFMYDNCMYHMMNKIKVETKQVCKPTVEPVRSLYQSICLRS